MGILVRKTEDINLEAPIIDISYKSEKFLYSGDPTQQAAVMRWALNTVQCAKDTVEEVTESKLNILTRFLTSFSVIYGYGVPKTYLLLEQFSKTSNLCLKSGNTLLFKVSKTFRFAN